MDSMDSMDFIWILYGLCIRSILEYASPVFHNGLTKYLSNDLEMVQMTSKWLTFPWTSYTDALSLAGLQQLDSEEMN